MTMQHEIHPDDERLAALAGGDPEVAADAALRAHVDTCDRCTDLVRELGTLRTALGELPDLIPSRPLQLLPPVAEPKAAASRGGWLRRLAGPAMAAGFVLVVVGAVGTSGFSLGLGASAGAAAPSYENDAVQPGAAEGQEDGTSVEPSPGQVNGSPATVTGHGGSSVPPAASGEFGGAHRSVKEQATGSPVDAGTGTVPPPSDSSGSPELFAPTDPRLPWLIVLGLGVGLLFAGIFLRFAPQPRAG